MGNRLTSHEAASYGYNSSNQLISADGTSFTHDHNGNTTTRTDANGQTTYAWNFENRLTSVMLPNGSGVVTFKYDPFGRRIQKSSASGTTIFVYDGANGVEELNASGAVTARYIQGAGIDEPLAQSATTLNFYSADGLGSITSLTDATGAIAATFVYGAFGVLNSSSGTTTNSYRYTAREFDQETGLYYYRARYYDPNIGRFLSEDPIGFGGGIDFYRFVHNNPLTFADPLGLAEGYGPQANHSRPPTGCHFPNCFWYYGNWGGPGWTGGQWRPYEDLSQQEKDNLAPPSTLRMHVTESTIFVIRARESKTNAQPTIVPLRCRTMPTIEIQRSVIGNLQVA